MDGTLLWLSMASLAFSSLSSLADGAPLSPLQVLAAPNIFRVKTPENVFVECQDCNGIINVNIKVMYHPTRNKILAQTDVTLESQNNYQALAQITIPDDLLRNYLNVTQYVYLQAQFPGRLLEKLVMVSFQSGYIFIQTDKTIYTPSSKVHYRMFAVNPGMEPIKKGSRATIEIETPDGIIFQIGTVLLDSGIVSGAYNIPHITSIGMWKVVAFIPSNTQQRFSAEFEIKEYVLPSFEVKLKPEKTFFKVDSKTFEVKIEAKYLYGDEVNGNAYIVFGVFHQDKKTSFTGSLQRVQVRNGEGKAILERKHINQIFPDILELVQSTIYATVSVLTQSGSELVEAEVRGIVIVTSPYTINFKKTSKYFKPGMPLDVKVHVTNPDHTPASGVPVMVNPGNLEGLTDDDGIVMVPVNSPATTSGLQITANTTDGSQASAAITVHPYKASSNHDLHIGVAKDGNNMQVTINFVRMGFQNHEITYLILSGGQIVKAGRVKRQGQTMMKELLTVTKEMLPSFRVIVYYHVSATEVVSDSVLVEAKYTCMGSLKLESATGDTVYKPGEKLRLKVTGDPGAMVGLVAVDKGVYVLNNKHRLTQRKVWDMVEKHDTGCTPGGGRDSIGMFYDAGLMFVTNTAFETPLRTDPKCPVSARRKRATTHARITLESQYKDELRKCCVDGMKDIPLSYDCQRRSEYIVDGQECIDAFLHCCTNLTSQRADKKQEFLHLARSTEDDDYGQDIIDIVSRSKFDESWLFDVVQLPNCSANVQCEYIETEQKSKRLPDSITTWQLTGISLSKSNGICVSEPFEVIARKQFFIDLRLPYSAVRGEQLEIKAILHNLNPFSIRVRLDLLETDHVCSMASRQKKYRQEVDVGSKSTRAVPFVIIPMEAGPHNIEVKGTVKDQYAGDGIKKKLLVVPAGELKKMPMTISLEPSKHNGIQRVTVNHVFPRTELVPNTPTQTQISITGGTQMSSLVENAFSGKSMEGFIRMPGGHGEMNIGNMAFPVIAATYLDTILKWEDVGFSKRIEALEHIRTGYTIQLSYYHGGCFSVWGNRKCTVRLTAYVVKVFAMARNLVTLDDNVLCGAVRWLITQQKSAGYFEDALSPFGLNTETSVTAFTLIAMLEARKVCIASVHMGTSINKAVAYLEGRLRGLTTTYAVAITSYALALADTNKFNKAVLLRFASGGNHWSVSNGQPYTLEATGYALLALVKARAFEEAKPIVKWLNQHRTYNGGYSNSQATVVVYQALAEYWTNTDIDVNELDVNLDVEISVAGRKRPDNLNFNRNNIYTTRRLKEKNAQNLNVTARGNGDATLTIVSLYYALPKEKESDCQKFSLSVELIPEKVGGDDDVYMLKIEVLYKDIYKDATMTILDIHIPTGFIVDKKDLDTLSTGVARTISKYEIDKALSEQGSIIIYLDKVSHERPEEIAFRISQKMKVGILQSASVSVYEYYNQKPCVKYYRPERTQGELLQLCRGDVCVCAEQNCSKQKKDKIIDDIIIDDARITMACHVELQGKNRVDYVYKVKVEHFQAGPSVDIYQMRIEKVLKEGTDAGVQNQLRAFISLPHCRESLGLKKDKTFLIMGMADDLYLIADKQVYEYVLGERTWIEYWPTSEECQTEEYRPVCLGMEDLDDQLSIFGCLSK